jgi:hypothetical protein
MTPNKSLQITYNFQEFMAKTNIEVLYEYLPLEFIKEYSKQHKHRERLFTAESTLIMMLLTAAQEDKSLHNSVSLYNIIHKNRKHQLEKIEQEEIAKQPEKKQQGRPRKIFLKAPKSQQQQISLNTSAYSQARARLAVGITEQVYKRTIMVPIDDEKFRWHNMPVFIVDGTYINMQDSPELRRKYGLRPDYPTTPPYPQCLLTAMIHQGSGKIVSIRKTTRSQSELASFYQMIEEIPAGSLVLADGLYNTYATISRVIDQRANIITVGKPDRKYRVVKTISTGDEIVEVKCPSRPEWLPEKAKMPERLLLRRIEINMPNKNGESMVFYSTLIDDNKYTQAEIATKFISRWDVEITIREIKILMDMEFLRGKTEDMIEKEINTTIAMYNIIREIMNNSANKGAFSPEELIFQKMLKSNQTILVDKKGRVYSRWSPGRYANVT